MQQLVGSGVYSPVGLVVDVDGADLVVQPPSGVRATWFGGDSDPEDDGRTASGATTSGHPHLVACALPMNIGPCKGSPIPRLPWGTLVRVYCVETGRVIVCPLIDLGPSPPPRAHAAIDLTVAAYKALSPDHTLGPDIHVRYRIMGGAQYVGVAGVPRWNAAGREVLAAWGAI